MRNAMYKSHKNHYSQCKFYEFFNPFNCIRSQSQSGIEACLPEGCLIRIVCPKGDSIVIVNTYCINHFTTIFLGQFWDRGIFKMVLTTLPL